EAGAVRVATEYPHLAHHFLNQMRVPDYRVFEVWGNAHAWPPEDADVAIVPEGAARKEGLEVLADVHRSSAWLIGNRDSLAQRDLREALDALLAMPLGADAGGVVEPEPLGVARRARASQRWKRERFRIAVPDGHAQRHTVAALAGAGIAFDGYE